MPLVRSARRPQWCVWCARSGMLVLAIVSAAWVTLASAVSDRPLVTLSQPPRQSIHAFQAPVRAHPLQAPAPALTSQTPDPSARALLDRYCVQCHSERLRTGGLTLQTIDTTRVPPRAGLWAKGTRKLPTPPIRPPGPPRPHP